MNDAFGGRPRARGTAMHEALERRVMFDGSAMPGGPEAVAVFSPTVLSAQFDASNAPHEVRFTFDRDVWASLDPADLELMNPLARFVVPHEVMTINWDFETNTASFVFVRLEEGTLPEGQWTARLVAEGVHDAAGTTMLQDFEFEFTYLPGDADGNGKVDMKDLATLAANFGQSDRNFTQGDFNYDGRVDVKDFGILASRFGTSVGGASFGDTAIGAERVAEQVLA